jgi:hypothetical protein
LNLTELMAFLFDEARTAIPHEPSELIGLSCHEVVSEEAGHSPFWADRQPSLKGSFRQKKRDWAHSKRWA